MNGKTLPQFSYADRGSLAVIGQNSAVVDLGFIKFTGFIAWLFWLLVHIYFLIEFDNKLLVMLQWGWHYFTRSRRARLITGKELPISPEDDKNTYYASVNDESIAKVSS